jgi:hypothetical protein
MSSSQKQWDPTQQWDPPLLQRFVGHPPSPAGDCQERHFTCIISRSTSKPTLGHAPCTARWCASVGWGWDSSGLGVGSFGEVLAFGAPRLVVLCKCKLRAPCGGPVFKAGLFQKFRATWAVSHFFAHCSNVKQNAKHAAAPQRTKA